MTLRSVVFVRVWCSSLPRVGVLDMSSLFFFFNTERCMRSSAGSRARGYVYKRGVCVCVCLCVCVCVCVCVCALLYTSVTLEALHCVYLGGVALI